MKINNDIFLSYLYCKYKAYLKLKGEEGEMSDYGLLQSKLQRDYKSIAISSLIHRSDTQSLILQKSHITHSDLKRSAIFIVDTILEHNSIVFNFDALKQVSGQSSLGLFYYIPIFFSGDNIIDKQQIQLLSLGGFTLERIQGVYPSTGIIVYGQECRFRTVHLEKYRTTIKQVLEELIAIANNGTEPKLILNKHCRMCCYERRCLEQAKNEDNLSLLARMTKNNITRLNRKGIFTIHQLSYTFRLKKKNKRLKTLTPPFYFSLQALAIREQKVYVFKIPTLPIAKTQVFIDMEGNAKGSFIYLIGILIVKNGEQTRYSFWADTPSKEKEIFTKFLTLLSTLNDTHLFYYGSYESRVLKRLLPLVPTDTLKNLLVNRSTNVLSIIYSQIYFPTYSNDLKEIGSYLGCIWTHPLSSGLQSIVWRAQWENLHDIKLKDTLIRYNQEDCTALKIVTDFIYQINHNDTFKTDSHPFTEVSLVDEIRQDEGNTRKWGKFNSACEGYNDIIQCAYFDYQRSKVYVRTNDKFKEINKRVNNNRRKPSYRINKKVDFSSRKCPYCKSTNVFRDRYNYHTKDAFDLRFFSGGIKRWVTRYRAAYHRCLDCDKSFVPLKYKRQKLFGHNLMAWAMQQHVSNRMTYVHISETLQDIFCLPIIFRRTHKFKSILAEYYNVTYKRLLNKLINGKIIHADETSVKLKQESGYVWVFTSMEEVVYMYRPNRKADFLHDILRDFKGVLITDFYTGYDSLRCLQQKCLVHLIRDINDELLKNPFDEELKKIGKNFGDLLKPIVETIDKYGLKSRYLRKHKKEVKTFFNDIAKEYFTSEVAQRFRQRMLKYQTKLFLFLDYDGVPWNNNNGEHAIKPFAKYRRLVNGRITEKGLIEYLTLLSLYETCEYKGIRFLEFLLSRERDIDKFSKKC